MNYLALVLLLIFVACSSIPREQSVPPAAPPPGAALFGGELGTYWYQGTAELSTYTLSQARYGELRDGQAVLIQVTEDFLTDKQVKNDAYENPNSTPVLKTNLIKRFTTGIYDYSLMTSVFTPTDAGRQPRSLKVTTTSQDWCGQSSTQLNAGSGATYRMQLRSYFEREADRDEELTADFLEDEVFNRIRIGGALPTGDFQIIPSTGYLLMTHQPYAAHAATVTLERGDGTNNYILDFRGLQRTLTVTYDAAPPYVIRRWTETYPSRGELLTTTATLEAQRQEAYWTKNRRQDDPLRAELRLR